jgi:MerR family transcriptional regulator/heat shock protein HspR
MKVAVKKKDGQLSNGTIKIGAVAKMFGVSVDLLRLYEREGLLIPLKSPKGTRYFTVHDFLWIGTILRLVREARLNFAGIRRLLALIPCWETRQCGHVRRCGCAVAADPSRPCWNHRPLSPVRQNCAAELPASNGSKSVSSEILAAVPSGQDCYFCPVYRSAASFENVRMLLAANNEEPKLVSAGAFE